MGWINTKDKLPDIGMRVLCVLYHFNNPNNEPIVLIGIRQEGLWHDDTIQANVLYEPHKWMELPNAN